MLADMAEALRPNKVKDGLVILQLLPILDLVHEPLYSCLVQFNFMAIKEAAVAMLSHFQNAKATVDVI
jgi:hypothetical protein